MSTLSEDYEALTGKLALLATWELPKYSAMAETMPRSQALAIARYICELVERINRLREKVVL